MDCRRGAAVALERALDRVLVGHETGMRVFATSPGTNGMCVVVAAESLAASAYRFAELTPATLDSVVRANLLGTMNGSRVALEGMLKRGPGTLYNMEGYGSDGARSLGMSVYGSTTGLEDFVEAALDEPRRRSCNARRGGNDREASTEEGPVPVEEEGRHHEESGAFPACTESLRSSPLVSVAQLWRSASSFSYLVISESLA